jgi:hypothetical protein
MQSFLKILGFITIFIGIIIGIYIISDTLRLAAMGNSGNPYFEQFYTFKLVAGGAIILLSVIAGILYLSFGTVIEILDGINKKLSGFEVKKESTGDSQEAAEK